MFNIFLDADTFVTYSTVEVDIPVLLKESLDSGARLLLRRASSAASDSCFAESLSSGLTTFPRRIDSRFLYDHIGSQLYEQICAQPEYYLTRIEASILDRYADDIAKATGNVALFELGSGSCEKTPYILSAYERCRERCCYVQADICEEALTDASSRLEQQFPKLSIIGVSGSYYDAFPLISMFSPVMVVFLGSSIGNLGEMDMTHFVGNLSASLLPGDFFLVGADLVKQKEILDAAYNDAAGITALFTRNLFGRMNRELGTCIDTNAVEHVAAYSSTEQVVEIAARFARRQVISIPSTAKTFVINEGEMIVTEISRKFRIPEMQHYFESFGFETVRIFTDPKKWYALFLFRRSTKLRNDQKW